MTFKAFQSFVKCKTSARKFAEDSAAGEVELINLMRPPLQENPTIGYSKFYRTLTRRQQTKIIEEEGEEGLEEEVEVKTLLRSSTEQGQTCSWPGLGQSICSGTPLKSEVLIYRLGGSSRIRKGSRAFLFADSVCRHTLLRVRVRHAPQRASLPFIRHLIDHEMNHVGAKIPGGDLAAYIEVQHERGWRILCCNWICSLQWKLWNHIQAQKGGKSTSE